MDGCGAPFIRLLKIHIEVMVNRGCLSRVIEHWDSANFVDIDSNETPSFVREMCCYQNWICQRPIFEIDRITSGGSHVSIWIPKEKTMVYGEGKC